MDKKEVKKHWENWAKKFGTDLRATDRSKTKKSLEIQSIIKALRSQSYTKNTTFTFLEVGCGVGHNCFGISNYFKKAKLLGIDYVDEMVKNATLNKAKISKYKNNIRFIKQDILDLKNFNPNEKKFDVILSNRCLINLTSLGLQKRIIIDLSNFLKKKGSLIICENPMEKFVAQNKLRNHLSLKKRLPPKFNLLLNEKKILEFLDCSELRLVYKDDFSSLHDLLLYVLIPSINNGEIDYDHPILNAAVKLMLSLDKINQFGEWGQNRLYLFKKK